MSLLPTGLPGIHQRLEGLPEGGQFGTQCAPTSFLLFQVPIHVTHTGPGTFWGYTPLGVVICATEGGLSWPREGYFGHIQHMLDPRAVGGQDVSRAWPELDLQVAAKGFRQPARVQVCREWKKGIGWVRGPARGSLGHWPSLSSVFSVVNSWQHRGITLRLIALTKCCIFIT